jgi:hypothetical protein
VKAEVFVIVVAALVGTLQQFAPDEDHLYHRTLFGFLLSFIVVDLFLFRILYLIAWEIRGRDHNNNDFRYLAFRVMVTGFSAFVIQSIVAAIVIKYWSRGHSLIPDLFSVGESDACDPVNFLSNVVIPLFMASFLFTNMAIARINARHVCGDHANNLRLCADSMD